MRVFVAGAGGAIGKQLIPLLAAAGHSVTGMTRSAAKAAAIRSLGAEPVVADALNAAAVARAVRSANPEAIIHELTAIPQNLDLRRFEEQFAATNRLRTEGTDHLLAAARSLGVKNFLGQSYAGWPYARTGGPVKSEKDPLDPNQPPQMRSGFRAIAHLEKAVTEAGGIVLRYGPFYGPGTSVSEGSPMLNEIRRRRVPVVGGGHGVWSFIHIADAAHATVAALERGKPGIYNVVDDEPAAVCEWLPALAEAVGARPPLRIPAWMGRLAIGAHGVMLMTEARGASNRKAKEELGWKPMWPSWRIGFKRGLASQVQVRERTLV